MLSANSLTLDDKLSDKSLVYIRNNNEPNVEPYRMPALTLVQVDKLPLRTKLCFLLLKKSLKMFHKSNVPNSPLKTFLCHYIAVKI